jgi:hypothetical protein
MPWRDLFRAKRPLDSQLDSELRFHIGELIEEKLAAGLTPERAKREASAGNFASSKVPCRLLE